MNPCEEKQHEIVQEFSFLENNHEMMLTYLMELGQQLPPYPAEFRQELFVVKGCQSTVWLVGEKTSENKIAFHADSNTAIVKGLAALLVRVFSTATKEEIKQASLFFMEKSGLSAFIGTQRSSGFKAMHAHILMLAESL